LGAGKTGYALLVTVSGVAIAIGSLMGKSGGVMPVLRKRFLTGIALFAAGMVAASASPVFVGVAIGVALGGLGNGMVIVFQRLIIQRSVDEELLGRVFGVQVALDGAAFTVSYLVAAGLLQLMGPRGLFIIAGVGATVVALGTAWVMRLEWPSLVPVSEPDAEQSAEARTEEVLAAVGSSELR
jgi:MFS family permease